MLPIVARELRVAAKRRVTYHFRWIVAFVGGVGVFVVSTAAQYSQEAGRVLFWSISAVMAVFCAASGLLLTADSVSREKRDGTLGLLFLTRVTSVDIILGKVTAGVLTGGGVAFSGLPLLAFTLCLGGVTAQELWLMSGALLFLLAYSLATGIFISTLFRRESVVTLTFSLVMIAPMAITLLALMRSPTIPDWLARTNPFFPAITLADTYGISFTRELAVSAVKFQGLTIVGILLASFAILPWTIRSEVMARGGRISGLIGRLNSLNGGKAPSRSNRDPIFGLTRKHGLAMTALLLAVFLYVAIRHAAVSQAAADVAAAIMLSFFPKLMALWSSSGTMAGERRSGFLETLLTTPLTSGEVLRGKMAAVKAQVAPISIGACVGLWAIAMKWWGESGELTVGCTLVFAAIIALMIDMYAIGWVGLWQGLVSRDRRRALVWSALIGMLLPCLPAAFGLPVLVWMLDAPVWFNEPKDLVPVAIISANVCSFAVACFAMARVHDKFRSTATQTWALRRSSEVVRNFA